MQGLIFNIQRFCINDGPGIRTTVFFKGCPLRCRWCHNPESQKKASELLYSSDKCIMCGRCEAVCENGVHILDGSHKLNRASCVACKKCEGVCPVNALEIAGKYVTAEEVLNTVLSDREFYEDSGGGLTLSGGEPFLQYEFMLEILKKAKENSLHICVETCGFADSKKLLSAAEYVDIFLFDYKLSDSVLHKEYTGVGNEKILENLKLLNENGNKIILRCPIIPDVNDTEEHFSAIAEVADSCENITGIEIAPYHELGISKSDRLGEKTQLFRIPEKTDVEDYINRISKLTRKSVKRM